VKKTAAAVASCGKILLDTIAAPSGVVAGLPLVHRRPTPELLIGQAVLYVLTTVLLLARVVRLMR
jgi:hypothetical protein